jgi:NADH-quinone oxidoreductase subunit J
MTLDLILFYLFAVVAVGASLGVVGQRNPMHSVLLLILSFGALAALYIQLDSPFAAVTQIIVYAGAIMVLFLFVVMLLNAPREDVPTAYGPSLVSLTVGARKRFALLAVVLVAELLWAITRFAIPATPTATEEAGQAVSSVRAIGIALFTDYAFAFEVTSVLILVAMVGAVVLAKKQA